MQQQYKYTNQEAFDIVAEHLLKQNARCTNSNGRCAYRGPNGLKYTAGALIPDELYNPEMDRNDMGWGSVSDTYPEVANLAFRGLVSRLQIIRDNRLLALEYELKRVTKWNTRLSIGLLSVLLRGLPPRLAGIPIEHSSFTAVSLIG